ncbi:MULTISPECIES: hypothetical protein [unclassified Leptolyngbya]|uniref:hypothetical protein n=1 Tax=unclassified Leptolyngbya TaxID=2650499 RepID=UPI001682CB75|nr:MULTISPECIES: hypothetical protein [unclassified Leptolyngbya]MBD1910594.1 hypothetical protein [Leptolyngbya sp. FACHB-8]MBD2154534.1 hypothetical protein [Leptolyngbya sp. FACHB-16]
MTRTLRSSQASTGSQFVKTLQPNVVVFPDGSVVWEEPEAVEPLPLPYAGYELPPLKAHQLSGIQPQTSARETALEMNTRTRWFIVGGAIALLTAGLGVTLNHLATLSTANADDSNHSPLGPIEMQWYSTSPTPAVLPGL